MPKLITATQKLREEFSLQIKEIAAQKSVNEMAVNAEITEPTVHNAINYPNRVKLETLERIILCNK